MALPLLLGLGAGILGGGQYLLHKMDEKRGQSLLNDMESFRANSPVGQYLDPYLAQAQAQINAGGILNRSSGQVSSLFDSMVNANQQLILGEQQRQRDAANRNYDRSRAVTDQLDQDYNRDLKVFGSIVQPAFRQALSALDNPNSADSVAALYNFFNIVEPGGRVTENEDGSFSGIGGGGARLANWLNEWRGEGLSDATRKQILSAIWKQYAPRYEQAQNQRRQYEQDLKYYGDQGLDVRSPIGRLGINWDLNQAPPAYTTEQGQPQIPEGWRAE